MPQQATLTTTELAALRAVDGTPTQPQMPPEIKARLLSAF